MNRELFVSLARKERNFLIICVLGGENSFISGCHPLGIGPWNSCLRRSFCIAQFHASLTCLGLLVLLTVPIRMFAQTSVQPGTFGVKLSGFENLVGGGASVGPGEGAGGRTESEIEVTPQYKTSSGTVLAARAVLKLHADSNANGGSYAWSLTVPELSFFTIGDFGRIEI